MGFHTQKRPNEVSVCENTYKHPPICVTAGPVFEAPLSDTVPLVGHYDRPHDILEQ